MGSQVVGLNDQVDEKKCERKDCQKRHPKRCKWMSSQVGCRRLDCDYLHDANERKLASNFKCVGCKNTWSDKMCVVEHIVQNQRVNFCLNCDDWVKYKERIFDQGWTLLDDAGFLRTGI